MEPTISESLRAVIEEAAAAQEASIVQTNAYSAENARIIQRLLAEDDAIAERENRSADEPVAEVEPVTETRPVVEAQPVAKAEPAASSGSQTVAESGGEPVAAKSAKPSFRDLALSAEVISAVEQSGYTHPTRVQSSIIPHMLAGRDVLAQSQTGTGKTAAFALPILSGLDYRQKTPQVLVLAPTRELAIQVSKSFSTYAANLSRFQVAAIYGGQDYEPQLRQLRRGVHVVVGTPGRVIDHIKRGTLNLADLKCLVLDEADEMLNMGFLEDVEMILEQTPPGRQVALFSATLPEPIRKISERYLNDPAKITVKKKTMTGENIRQRAIFVAPRLKQEVLKRFLEIEETDGVIVFTKTKDSTISVAEKLIRDGFNAIALNGDMPQKVRERAIDSLKAGRIDVLVATDVAARGLDVQRISHVINFDLPHDSESYVHRVGRTGRAGRAGEAVIFLTKAQRGKLRLIERATKQPIEVIDPPSADDLNERRVERFKKSIAETVAEKNLDVFVQLVKDCAEESGVAMEQIAAALAFQSQNGRSFFAKELPKNERDDRGRDDSRGAKPFGKHRSVDGEFDDSRRPPRKALGPPREGMTRYRIEVGRHDRVKPGNIVGAIANEGGIDGEFIGPILIHDKFTIVDLPSGMPADVYQTLQKTRVAGKPLRLKTDDGGPNRNEPGSFGNRGGKFGARPGRPGGGRPNAGRTGPGKPARDGKPKSFKNKKRGRV